MGISRLSSIGIRSWFNLSAYDAENAGLFRSDERNRLWCCGCRGTLLEERTTEGTPILTLPDMSNPTYLTALIDAAKEYIDAGVDGFQYDVGGSYHAGGSFDDATVAGFYNWLTGTSATPMRSSDPWNRRLLI